MTSSTREQVWNRIMVVQEEFNRLEARFAAIPTQRIGWWLRWRFKRAVHAMIEARGAHSHGELTHISEERLPKLECAAKVYSRKLSQLERTANEIG